MVKINEKTRNILAKTAYWLFLLFMVYLIYEIVRYLLGGSLGFEELMVGLLITNIGYSFYLRGALGKVEKNVDSSIHKVEKRMIEQMNRLEKRMAEQNSNLERRLTEHITRIERGFGEHAGWHRGVDGKRQGSSG
ncbi:MAG: hypothetical protein V1743_02605 [Nanoarchaeota archaeon]